MLETMKSHRDEFKSLKKTSNGEVDQTSSSASKPSTSKQPENLDPTPPRTQSSSRADEVMDVDLHGPPLPPHLKDMVHLFLLISKINSPFRILT